jgi:NAD(P)-dependent dehydrogenase (short-subunit alcohol dehydrogenase family)
MTGIEKLFGLDGKTALITGAGGGLGQAVAELFAAAGARLILLDRTEEMMAPLVAKLRERGGTFTTIAVDLLDITDLRAKALALVRNGDIPDCLVLNAGMQGPAGPLGEITEEDWNSVMTVNLLSAHALTSVFVPPMARRGGGGVVLMASIAGLRGNKSIGLYGLTKAALTQLARNIAVEWGPLNIRANAIAPGLIRTPLARDLMDNSAFMVRRLSMTPLRRVGKPEEIAATALYLCSDAGGFTTGQTIVVDGGTLISDGS